MHRVMVAMVQVVMRVMKRVLFPVQNATVTSVDDLVARAAAPGGLTGDSGAVITSIRKGRRRGGAYAIEQSGAHVRTLDSSSDEEDDDDASPSVSRRDKARVYGSLSERLAGEAPALERADVADKQLDRKRVSDSTRYSVYNNVR